MTKLLLSTLIIMSAQLNLSSQQSPDPAKIVFPPEYEPSKSKFYVHNEIEVDAPPELVWEILIAAPDWPNWYEGANNVVLLNQTDQLLNANSVFSWKTMGLHFESTIKAFEPNRYLCWESKKRIIRGYHAWLIIPTPNGCKVITDESQNGWLTFFEKTFQPKKLQRLHDIWLAGIKRKAEEKYLSSM